MEKDNKLNAKWLIDGGYGFIGSYLLTELYGNGYRDLTIIDDRSVPSALFHKKSFINFTNIEDFVNKKSSEIDIIVLARSKIKNRAPGNVEELLSAEKRYVSSLCAKCTNVKHVIFLSSGGAVYGKSDKNHYFHENSTFGATTPYGRAKREMEDHLKNLQRFHRFKLTILRPGNPIGPPHIVNRNLNVVDLFLDNVFRKVPSEIWGDIENKKDFFDVRDLAKIIRVIVEKSPKHKIYNVGCGQSYTLAKLIENIEDITKLPFIYRIKDYKITDIPSYNLNVTRINDEYPEIISYDLIDTLNEMWIAKNKW